MSTSTLRLHASALFVFFGCLRGVRSCEMSPGDTREVRFFIRASVMKCPHCGHTDTFEVFGTIRQAVGQLGGLRVVDADTPFEEKDWVGCGGCGLKASQGEFKRESLEFPQRHRLGGVSVRLDLTLASPPDESVGDWKGDALRQHLEATLLRTIADESLARLPFKVKLQSLELDVLVTGRAGS